MPTNWKYSNYWKNKIVSAGAYLGPKNRTVQRWKNDTRRVALFPIMGYAKLIWGPPYGDEDPTKPKLWQLRVMFPGSKTFVTIPSPKEGYKGLNELVNLIEQQVIPQYLESCSEVVALSKITSERVRVTQLMDGYPKNGYNYRFQDSYYNYLGLLSRLEASILNK